MDILSGASITSKAGYISGFSLPSDLGIHTYVFRVYCTESMKKSVTKVHVIARQPNTGHYILTFLVPSKTGSKQLDGAMANVKVNNDYHFPSVCDC